MLYPGCPGFFPLVKKAKDRGLEHGVGCNTEFSYPMRAFSGKVTLIRALGSIWGALGERLGSTEEHLGSTWGALRLTVPWRSVSPFDFPSMVGFPFSCRLCDF